MEASLYIVDCNTRENADTLRSQWLKGSTAVEGRETELLAPLTENQVFGLQRDHGFTVTPAPAKA